MVKIHSMIPGVVLLLVLLLCTACGGSRKMPDDLLKTAVQNEDGNYSDYGLSITSFQVSDRNYDQDYKTESVAVDIQAENADSTYMVSYMVMGQYADRSWNVTSVL